MKASAVILVVDSDGNHSERFQFLLESQGHRVKTVERGDSALEEVRRGKVDLILADLWIRPEGGLRLLEQVKRESPETLVVLTTEKATTESAIDALRKGAHDYLIKPIQNDELLLVVARAVCRRQMGMDRKKTAEQLRVERARNSRIFRDLDGRTVFEGILGHSPSMNPIREMLQEVTRTNSTVLITGESGTGKGLLARVIHYNSPRSDKPFVEANCGIYSEGVLQSELFGHEKGSFTGAVKQKRGRFELAHQGTIFLDEIGDLSPGTQLMLLRILQERKFERVGGEETRDVDVRVIAATNCDLLERMRKGQFRSDLYYRLNVIPILIPPLRNRKEDIPSLSISILQRCAGKLGRNTEGITPDAMETLVSYSWPGNIRELENLIERTLILSKNPWIRREDLPLPIREGSTRGEEEWPTLIVHERDYILKVLEKCGGNKKLTASLLGINRSSLYSKLKRLGIGSFGDLATIRNPVSRPEDPGEIGDPPPGRPGCEEEAESRNR